MISAVRLSLSAPSLMKQCARYRRRSRLVGAWATRRLLVANAPDSRLRPQAPMATPLRSEARRHRIGSRASASWRARVTARPFVRLGRWIVTRPTHAPIGLSCLSEGSPQAAVVARARRPLDRSAIGRRGCPQKIAAVADDGVDTAAFGHRAARTRSTRGRRLPASDPGPFKVALWIASPPVGESLHQASSLSLKRRVRVDADDADARFPKDRRDATDDARHGPIRRAPSSCLGRDHVGVVNNRRWDRSSRRRPARGPGKSPSRVARVADVARPEAGPPVDQPLDLVAAEQGLQLRGLDEDRLRVRAELLMTRGTSADASAAAPPPGLH